MKKKESMDVDFNKYGIKADDDVGSVASTSMDDLEASSWTFLEGGSSIDSSESGVLLRIEEVDNPSDFESDGSSIVVVDDASVTHSSEETMANVPEVVELFPRESEGSPAMGALAADTNQEEPYDRGMIEDADAENQREMEESNEELLELEEFPIKEEDPDDAEDGPFQESTVNPVVSSEDVSHYKPPPDLLEVANRIDEMDQLDYSTLTQQDFPADLPLADSSNTRHYIHHRNSRLNLLLNFVVAFSLAAVLGFGLGHFIGLSDNFPPRPGCSRAPDDIIRGKGQEQFEDWTEADLRSELQRMNAENFQLREALESKNSFCITDKHDDLVKENEDLKTVISKIRYGRPVRSYEDRDRINHLETENQELRELVGKLRYSCKGSDDSSSPFVWNVTDFWNRNVLDTASKVNITHGVKEQLGRFKQASTEIVRMMEELRNISQQIKSPEVVSVITQTFSESLENMISLGSKYVTEKGFTSSSVVANLAGKINQVMLDLQKSWNNVKKKFDAKKPNSKQQKEGNVNLNKDWFMAMGRKREALRTDEKRSDWIFNRAQGRGKERQRKYNTPYSRQRKQNVKQRYPVPKYKSSKY